MPKDRTNPAVRSSDRHPTIRDVAAAARVSVATVSRVFNAKDVVREETVRRVREVAERLGYVPNLAARALSVRRAHTIGILLPDVHGEFFSELLRGIDIAARAAGYHILISGWHSDLDEMLAMINALRGRVDGLLLMAPDVPAKTLRQEIQPRIPVVLLNSDAHAQVDSVRVDNSGGARAVMEHLTGLGHRRIAFIDGPPENIDARERRRGYRRGLPPGVAPVEVEGDFTEDGGYDAIGELLELEERPTAIFAANDATAIGAISALADRGIAVPREVSVVGFDDVMIARYANPTLTTVHVDTGELGRRAVSLLFDSIQADGEAGRRAERLGTSLVIRNSSGVPDKGRPRRGAPKQLQSERRRES